MLHGDEGVDALGVHEHVWAHTGPSGTGMVTGIVEDTATRTPPFMPGCWTSFRDVPERPCADWLKNRGTGFAAGIKPTVLGPFRGYANAIRDELPETIIFPVHRVCKGTAPRIDRPADKTVMSTLDAGSPKVTPAARRSASPGTPGD